MKSILLAIVAFVVLALTVNDVYATGFRFSNVVVANVGGVNVLVAPGISRGRAVVRSNVGLFGVRSRVVNVNRGRRARVVSVNRGFGANVVAINNAGAFFAPSNVFVNRGFVGNRAFAFNVNPFASRAVLVNPSAAFGLRQQIFGIPAISSFQAFGRPAFAQQAFVVNNGFSRGRVVIRGRGCGF